MFLLRRLLGCVSLCPFLLLRVLGYACCCHLPDTCFSSKCRFFIYYSDLSDEISEYIKKHYSKGVVKLIRQKTRQGLIRSRLEGIKRVTGEVVVFLDSHMEVNNHWYVQFLVEIIVSKKNCEK